MKIGGLQKLSMIDFPGKISTMVFTQGCNFRCQFCHNRSLVIPEEFQKTLDENTVLEFIKSRKGKIEAVVVSGGEPTLHGDLECFLRKIKCLKLLTKLDTNGTNPECLIKLYENKLLDYVAMDVKHTMDKYSCITNFDVDVGKIRQSIELIRSSDVSYEFRTTIIPKFHTPEDIKSIALELKGSKKFVIQEFRQEHSLNKNLNNDNSIFESKNKAILNDIRNFCQLHIQNVEIRALQ